MDGNKDEALRCLNIAREAIAAGNKQRALKFIGIAHRLNKNLPLDDLSAACENLDSPASVGASNDVENVKKAKNDVGSVNSNGISNGERNYTEEHLQVVRQVKSKKDYYSILGVEKSCSVEEIRKAYRKLSLKVHPDKNKAPGSEEAFKKVSKAFKCLSDGDSRKFYDQTGFVDEFEHNQQHNVRQRRRRTGNDFFDDDFDPDEIFRAFFGQRDAFRNSHVYRTRTAEAGAHHREDLRGNGPNLMFLIQLLPFLIIILLAYLPFSEPEYSLQKNYSYQYKKMTGNHGIEFFVKSPDFDQNYPSGSSSRQDIENNVIKDYKHMLGRYCHMEMQRRHWNRHFPTPHCDRLESLTS